MVYVGSKAKYIKYILPIILKNRRENQYYVEPFVGGFNVIHNINGLRIASDNNKYLIAIFKELQNGWIPPSSISEEYYIEVRNNKDKYPDYIVGYVGYFATFASKWYAGYARAKKPDGRIRNISNERWNNLMKQLPGIVGIDIYCCDYTQLSIPNNSIIYCDPPYKNTIKYIDEFDSEQFYLWCEQQVNLGHTVYVSEYINNVPNNWQLMWSKKVNSTLDLDTGAKQNIESLYMVRL